MEECQNGDEASDRLRPVRFSVIEVFHEIQYRFSCHPETYESRSDAGLKTGFRDLDAITGGFNKGSVVFLGSRPGMGKSTLAMNIAIKDELTEGFDALKAQREGKVTLRTHAVEAAPVAEVVPEELIALRKRLNVSRAVLAARLRTNPRTLENWEQGRARPNAQAALLIRLVARYPETMDRLAVV